MPRAAAQDAPVSIKTAKRLDIQGLRAVAVLLVVLFHAGVNLPGGFTGVDVFFAISGFVIGSVLVADLERAGTIRFSRFYARRVKRLLPALAVMVGAVSLLGVLASPVVAERIEAENGVWAALFSANIYLLRMGAGYFDVSTDLNAYLHTWTLAVEEQFYLVFPLVLLIGWKLGARRGGNNAARVAAALAVSLVTVVSFVLCLALMHDWHPPRVGAPAQFAFYGSPSRAWEFGLGAVLALLIPWLIRLPRGVAVSLSLGGCIAIALGAVVIEGTAHFPGVLALLPVGGACALLAAGTSRREGAYRALAIKPMVWIGDRSYSWYLWHWPLIVYARALWPGAGWAAPAAAAFSLGPAWASYRYVENPIRFSTTLRGTRVVALAAICVAFAVGACAVLYEGRHVFSTSAALAEFSRAQALHVDVTRRCDSPIPLGRRSAPQCTWTVPNPRGKIVLIGDSNAGQYTEPFVRAANRAGYDATVATLSACPFLPVGVRGAGQPACLRFARGSLAALLAMKPNLVLAAAHTSGYLDNPAIALAFDGRTFSNDSAEKAGIWERSLAFYVRRLNAAGISVVVVHEVLMPPTAVYDPSACAVVRVLLTGCQRSFSRRAAQAGRALAAATETRAIAGAGRTWTLDFANDLCGRTRCAERRRGVLMFRDQSHLSVGGALMLTDHFYRVISERARR